ncbi:MAG: acylphosphatase [Rhodocyclales bacterium]|nr:acylphosphatase [Rhodocyclales bacterium]
MQVRRLVITGLVQGVGFRYGMAAEARLLGVTGWVRNRRDGSVEAMIAGNANQIEAMLEWSNVGPGGAVVENVMCETASGEFAEFELRPTA